MRESRVDHSPFKPLVRKHDDVGDLPSNISEDEWGEIQRYNEVLAKEEKAKSFSERKINQRKIRETLDMQIRQQKAHRN